MTANNITATSISLSWTSAGTENVSYVVTWQTDNVGGCSGGNDTGSMNINDGSTSYNITELEEDSSYKIIVTASNSAGSVDSNTVNAVTMEAGERAIVSGHVLLKFMVTLPAPSGAPTFVSVSAVNSTTLSVQWKMVPCIEQNGDITEYTVHVLEIGVMETVDHNVTLVNISQLTPSTTYSIEVAAVNIINTGIYSDPIIFNTPDSEYVNNHVHFLLFFMFFRCISQSGWQCHS